MRILNSIWAVALGLLAPVVGEANAQQEVSTVTPFKINIDDSVLDDLKTTSRKPRLNATGRQGKPRRLGASPARPRSIPTWV